MPRFLPISDLFRFALLCFQKNQGNPFLPTTSASPHPEGPARHLDASRQKLSPHCLAAIFDSQLPSPKLPLKMPNASQTVSPPQERAFFSSFKIAPAVRVIARQLSGKNCLAAIFASWHQDASPGPLGKTKGGWKTQGRGGGGGNIRNEKEQPKEYPGSFETICRI